MIFLSIRYVPDQYMIQQICDRAVNDCLAELKLVFDWFITSKMIKMVLLLCTQMNIYSTLMKVRVMSYLIVMEWVL